MEYVIIVSKMDDETKRKISESLKEWWRTRKKKIIELSSKQIKKIIDKAKKRGIDIDDPDKIKDLPEVDIEEPDLKTDRDRKNMKKTKSFLDRKKDLIEKTLRKELEKRDITVSNSAKLVSKTGMKSLSYVLYDVGFKKVTMGTTKTLGKGFKTLVKNSPELLSIFLF